MNSCCFASAFNSTLSRLFRCSAHCWCRTTEDRSNGFTRLSELADSTRCLARARVLLSGSEGSSAFKRGRPRGLCALRLVVESGVVAPDAGRVDTDLGVLGMPANKWKGFTWVQFGEVPFLRGDAMHVPFEVA